MSIKISRRMALKVGGGVAVGAFGVMTRQAHAAEFNYKLGTNVPESHPVTIRVRDAAKKIKEESGGQLAFEIFPNNQLGGDTVALSQLRSGALEFYLLSGLILANVIPVVSIYGMPFAFGNHSDVWKALDGDFGIMLRNELPKAGLQNVGKMWANGFRQFVSGAKVISSAEDLNGFKMRVPISQLWISVFKALGASPVSMNATEMYTSLQTKVADGCELPLAVIDSYKIYEVQKYCSMSNYMVDNYFMAANAGAWTRLPEKLKEIAERNFNAAADMERADIAKLDTTLQSTLTAKGLSFNSPDIQSFKSILKKSRFYEDWRKKYGEQAWGLLEKYSGSLG